MNVDARRLGEWGCGSGSRVQQGVNWEAQIAKANAVLAVLQWGIELGASKLIVESDCLMVI